MDMDLQELQLKSVSEMLQFSADDEIDPNTLKTWKVLIYDDESKKILSPILKIGELRRLGVTLNMSINDKRDEIPGVDAVYLVSPCEESVKVIINDAKERKYSRIHINFTTCTSDEYLIELARKFVEKNAFSVVSSVTDRYIHFVSLSPSTFSLNLPGSFRMFYGDETEETATDMLDTLVDRLLSVIVTLGMLPIIRVTRTASPASSVAEKLNKKLFDLVGARHQLGISLASSYNRPMLVILDRNVDLSSIIQHSWSYQSLLHDIFGIKYNKVTVEAGPQHKKMTCELDSGDKIYQSIFRMPLSDVALHIASSLEYHNSKISQINRGDNATTGSLVDAMNAIPHLTEQKRLLDMHTNLATALVDAVKEREIDRFYEFECDLNYMSEKNCIQNFEELLSSEKAKPMDKYRSLLLMALSKTSISESKLDEYEMRIGKSGNIKCGSLKGLRSVVKMKAFSENLLKNVQSATTNILTTKGMNCQSAAAPVTGTQKAETSQSHKRLADYSSKIIDTGFNIFKGVRNLLPRKKDLYIVNIMENLINNPDSVAEEFVSYDPKTSESVLPKSARRITTKKSMVFVVGGGCYNEAVAMQDLGTKIKHTIFYGSTFFDRPEEFVEQLGSFQLPA